MLGLQARSIVGKQRFVRALCGRSGAGRPAAAVFGFAKTRHECDGARTGSVRGFSSGAQHVQEPTIVQIVQQGKYSDIPIERTRNFSVIAHIDHGKSTLSDALLSITGNITERERKSGQFLDRLQVERERGITVKATTASMLFTDNRIENSADRLHLLNLIDTPGHVDFNYEVSRSLASCTGCLLLVDASQGIQAQTLSNYALAKDLGLKIVPVVTKVDLPYSMPEEAALALAGVLNCDPDEVLMTSAKSGKGILEVLQAIVDRLPPPESPHGRDAEFRGRIVDSWFDEHRGVVCLVQVVDGCIRETDRIVPIASTEDSVGFSVQEVGVLTPTNLRTGELRAGQVGYVIAGMRSTKQARVGDTLFVLDDWRKEGNLFMSPTSKRQLEPLDGYRAVKPMLYASVYPMDSNQLDVLVSSVERLQLNDSALSVAKEASTALGSGLRCGFLGHLHMEIFTQRLKDEFNIDAILTTPTVPYVLRFKDGTEMQITNLAQWPEHNPRSGPGSFTVYEPMVEVTIVTPHDYVGALMDTLQERRGKQIEVEYLEGGQVILRYHVPWQEVVSDLHDQTKTLSSGYASLNYKEIEPQPADLVKVEIAVNGQPCEPLSFVAHRDKAEPQGRRMAAKLKDVLERQQFEIIIQAKLGTKILARERIAPYRKDVLTKSGKTVGGGDVSRKKKLLAKQKEGKAKSKRLGSVDISQEAFWTVLSR